ncbi:MAG: FGGY-family carbohydrate kinase [Bacillota bacterium]|nr:FGGY-family carbohydrate kinase [Bacillota bacterium]
MAYVIAVDVGTTCLKACLFETKPQLKMINNAEADYEVFPMENGGMEQDHDQWWAALCKATKELIKTSEIAPEEISGFSVCAQMLGLALVDRDGVPVHRPMNYLDRRGVEERRKGMGGGIKVADVNIRKLLTSLHLTKVAPLDVADTVWKYKWIEAHEPENFAKAYKWLDVKDYLNMRCTDRMVMTEDSAYTTMLYENKGGKKRFSSRIMKMYGVNEEHMPEVIGSTDIVGTLTAKAAEEMGLAEGTPVFGGGGDASCITLGSGHVEVGKTHIYIGTSGWVSTVCDTQPFDPINMIASLYGAEEGRFNYHAEMNAAGKCFEWLHEAFGKEATYDELNQAAKGAPAGAGGVIFAPWLAGERCPNNITDPCGMFYNLNLRTDRGALVRAVMEGVAYHIKLMMEKHEKKVPIGPVIRLVGGGALSSIGGQILADITGRHIEVIYWPQYAGAVGAAVISAVGLGIIPGFEAVKDYVPIEKNFTPNKENREVYERQYEVYKKIYSTNKKLLRTLNKPRGNE